MKKLFSILLTLILTFALFGCNEPNTTASLEFYAPDGAPALSIAKFINDKENFGMDKDVSVHYNVVSANNIGPTNACKRCK